MVGLRSRPRSKIGEQTLTTIQYGVHFNKLSRDFSRVRRHKKISRSVSKKFRRSVCP